MSGDVPGVDCALDRLRLKAEVKGLSYYTICATHVAVSRPKKQIHLE
jgi:hypothetical protein